MYPVFFDDPRHIGNQFSFMTMSEPRNRIVLENFATQIQFLEKYVLNEIKEDPNSIEALNAVREHCVVGNGGNFTPYHLKIFRMIGDIVDKRGADLFRTNEDEGQVTKQPYFLVKDDQVSKSISFDIIVERKSVLQDIEDLPSAIASYVHIAFILNMKYPKTAETLCDILQRKFARFGSEEGTRTNKSVKSAMKGIDQFYRKLGSLL